MDIEAISGPRSTESLQPAISNNAIEPIERVLAPMINDTIRIDWNVLDRITISPAARRKFRESHKNRQDQKKKPT